MGTWTSRVPHEGEMFYLQGAIVVITQVIECD